MRDKVLIFLSLLDVYIHYTILAGETKEKKETKEIEILPSSKGKMKRAARLRLFCAAYLSISFARSATSATVRPVRLAIS
ncbi:hypothetical protein N231_05520 [Geobacillus stearothermophilus ATCC 12980]|nr:hypothetical protein N231_05520 [Geobacillus stearothermophilus ATCC 12980]